VRRDPVPGQSIRRASPQIHPADAQAKLTSDECFRAISSSGECASPAATPP
jgi:hypothetical protein